MSRASTPRTCSRCHAVVPDDAAVEACPSCGSRLQPPTALPDDTTGYAQPAEPTGTGGGGPAARTAPFFGPAGPPPPGLAFANYDVLSVIDTGGMGVVFRAWQRRAEREVALKVIHPTLLGDARQRNRFATEAKALARLRHPHVVQVFEVADDVAGPFFSMELMPGGSLADRVRGGPLPPTEAARVMADVSDAVAYAHDQGVLHRDLKPGNVLLTSDGQPKVSDFGLAKLLDQLDGPTLPGAVLGTPSFMAPEQAAGGTRKVGPAADVYGLGATLYALLTGRPPFQGETPAATVTAVANDPLVPPREVNPDVPPELDAICAAALAKNPADRYPSAAALAEDLRRWLRGEPPAVRPPTRLRRAGRWVWRHRVAVAAAVLLPLLAAAVVVVKRENDPLVQLERKLARGERVVVVGPTGKPAWHRWLLGATELTDSAENGGACWFQTNTQSLLELVPDPRCDRYRVSADFLDLGGNPTYTAFGLFVDFGPTPPQSGDAVRWLSLEHQFYKRPAMGGRPPLSEWRFTANDHMALFGYGQPASHGMTPVALTVSAPSQSREWRTMAVEVTPDGVAAFRRQGGEFVRAFDVPAAKRAAETALHEQKLPDVLRSIGFPPVGPTVPPAGTRGAIGVYALEAVVAFRNVVFEPLP